MIPNAWGATDWLWPSSLLVLFGLLLVLWTYARSNASNLIKFWLGFLKSLALVLLIICLLEPTVRFERPEKGANLMIVMADDSQSLRIKDRGDSLTREQRLKEALSLESGWLQQLAADFDVRRYQFDRRLRPVANFVEYGATERGSDILNSLELVAGRFSGRPTAGVLLLTDGNATNPKQMKDVDWSAMPPVYPVVVGKEQPGKDICVTKVTSSQTNFESAPVTIAAELLTHGYAGRKIVVKLLDETGKTLEKKEVKGVKDGRPFAVRFTTRPQKNGVSFYRVEASADGESTSEADSLEATLVNNQRLVKVDRGRGPFRILYVTGRPNWELKFLRRSLQEDEELDMVALVRIAKREAKFTFRGRDGQDSNSLFRGFASQDDDTTEQHDEPVFLRLGTRDEFELKDGFPKDAETLYQYDAVVIDDLEAGFFTEDQKSLLQRFVTLRGGGFLMLGGQESFAGGSYDRTPIGEMLPVYINRVRRPANEIYQLDLTREGWLQPWVRIKSTETEETRRLATMPRFRTVNASEFIKPGASVLATVTDQNQQEQPALVVQSFGKGRTAALAIGDLWRWQLQSDPENEDLLKAWRQMMRWLVADVPRRVEVEARRLVDANQTTEIITRVRDEAFRPYDNATLTAEVTTPEGNSIPLAFEATMEAGTYKASFVSNSPGTYKATIIANSDDGTEIEERETGWVSEPASEEFQRLEPNRELLNQIAVKSGGELIELNELDSFVNTIDQRDIPITETRSRPWWHRWTIFSIALGLLVCEWGIRRWKGLP